MKKDSYKIVLEEREPLSNFDIFKQIVKRTFKGEIFLGLKVTFSIMKRALFNKEMATVQYPKEKLPVSPRYRAIHRLLRFVESENERCISCGLCEKICISNCIKMETRVDENSRKELLEYTINMGRCIYCGYCAEVCPELAIVHGDDYEQANEQRSLFSLKDDILTNTKKLQSQVEFEGFGSISNSADKKIKKTPQDF